MYMIDNISLTPTVRGNSCGIDMSNMRYREIKDKRGALFLVVSVASLDRTLGERKDNCSKLRIMIELMI